MLEQEKLRAIEARCTQESPPRCTNACPLGMDVRGFCIHLMQDRPRDARKLIERHIPLPGIVCAVCDHPCEDACLRRDLGGSLAVSALEKLVMREVGQQTRPLVRPPKPVRLAVLGAGLAGLVAASDIATKGYAVTVYHEGEAGAALHAAFPGLDSAVVEQEFATLAKFHVAFEQAELSQELCDTVAKECAAVFVDASVCSFAPGRDAVPATTRLWHDAVCCGGWLATSPTGANYASASAQAGDGRKASATLLRLMTGASLEAGRENEDRTNRLHTVLDGIAPAPKNVPADDAWTMEAAQAEASRCINCGCLQCVPKCPFLQKYGEFPRVYARKIYGNATIVRGTRTANALVNGCALCGQCEAVCPERFSMAEVCLDARQDAVARDVMPASAHEFALEDMAQASGPESAFWLDNLDNPAATGAPARHVFFPGCQLTATRGEQVLAMFDWLRAHCEGGVALAVNCCGIPARWAGREAVFAAHAAHLAAQWQAHGKPAVIVACATCKQALAQILPDASIISLWEVLDERMAEPFGGQVAASMQVPASMQVQDPCGARHDAAWQKAVRSLMAKAGIAVQEPPRTGEKTACCGYGGLVWNAQADVADAMAATRAADFSLPVLASCSMCRDRLSRQVESWHVFDILPPTSGRGVGKGAGKGTDGSVGPQAGDPGLSARRAGRVALKQRVREQYGLADDCCTGEALPGILQPTSGPDADIPPVQLAISPDVLAAMERRFILRQDVTTAVAGVESTGAKFLNRENGHWLGSWRPRNVTFWVEYTADGQGGFVLHDAWCHRMVLSGATQPAEEVELAERVHA